jgi:hypothetical protein
MEHVVVVEHEVVGGEHGRVLAGHTHLVARVPNGGDGLDVVPVAVRLEDPAHVEPLAQLEQLLVLVGGVQEHGVARLLAAQHEDVVVHRAHDQLVDLGLGILEMHLDRPV